MNSLITHMCDRVCDADKCRRLATTRRCPYHSKAHDIRCFCPGKSAFCEKHS